MSKVEVYLDPDQVKNLKHILEQSEMGHHLLFENKLIAEVFQKDFSEDDFFQVENMKTVQNDLIDLLHKKSLFEKKAFIAGLKPERLEKLVRAYFYIIENNMKNAQKRPH